MRTQWSCLFDRLVGRVHRRAVVRSPHQDDRNASQRRAENTISIYAQRGVPLCLRPCVSTTEAICSDGFSRHPAIDSIAMTMNPQVSRASGGRSALLPRPQDQGDSGPQAPGARSPEATDFSPHTQPGGTDKVRISAPTAATGTPPARAMAIYRKRLSVSPPGATGLCFICFPLQALVQAGGGGNEKRAIRARIARLSRCPSGFVDQARGSIG